MSDIKSDNQMRIAVKQHATAMNVFCVVQKGQLLIKIYIALVGKPIE